MNLPIKSALASVASIAAVGAFAIPAHADSNSDYIHKTVTRSATHRIAYVKITVECSDDTDSAALSVRLTQVTPAGTVQQATGAQTNIGGFECTGDPESVTVAVRRPTGGYNWQAGTAVADHAVFVTHDPSGTYFSSASRRTVTVK